MGPPYLRSSSFTGKVPQKVPLNITQTNCVFMSTFRVKTCFFQQSQKYILGVSSLET